MESEFDSWDERSEKDEPWKKSLDLPTEESLRFSYAEPGGFAEQQLRLDEIDDLINDNKYGRAKCLLDEMIPVDNVNIAEHSFQLARFHFSSNMKDSSLDKALIEIEKAISLESNLKRYNDYKEQIVKNRNSSRLFYGVLGTFGVVMASGIGYSVYSLVEKYFN